MEQRWRIELFGELRAQQGDRIVTRFPTQKTAGLLAYLAYFCRRSHSRDALIEILWPGGAPQAARQSLSQALSSLRHLLEPPGLPGGSVIVADRTSVRLNPDAVVTDVAEFEAALQAARHAACDTERVSYLTQALELYRGPLLPDQYEEWVLGERERLAERYFQALSPLLRHLEQAHDWEQALEHAQRGVRTDPLREEAHRDLIRLLVAAGQPAAALRQYHRLERLLRQELGEAPTAATRALVREIERSTTTSPSLPAASSVDDLVLAPRGWDPQEAPLTGTVTFLLAALDVSPERALRRLLVDRYGGHPVKIGDGGFTAVFARASDALSCAVTAQQAGAAGSASEAGRPPEFPARALPIPMALDTAEVELQDGKYPPAALRRAGRVLGAAHPGQILCTEETAMLLRHRLDPGVQLVDLGLYRLEEPERKPRAAPASAGLTRLFQIEYPGMVEQEFPPLRSERSHAGTLPALLTRFFGREGEIARLLELLAEPGTARLVTLTGPGGSGKTRLAQEVAGRLFEAWRGAVCFVSLADLATAGQIDEAIRDALRLPRSAGADPLEQVVVALTRQRTLLLLDNFEHLVEDGASRVRILLERVPSLTCLVTSRRRLHLAGEQEIFVPPLPTPDGLLPPERLARCESVQLFVDRAQAVCPDFQLSPANAQAVAALCNRLEGFPLAIELAAARAQVLTPAQMLTHLERRFDFLVNRQRDAAARHRTLRAALEWSYRLLAPELQRFFRQLYVYRGGWNLEAAETVCEEPLALDALEQLRECSLVLAEVRGEETRFRMLETLREFAHEQLPVEEQRTLERRHAEYYLALAEEAEPGLFGPQQAEWLEKLGVEYDNLRAVLAWSQATGDGEDEDRRCEIGLRLAGILWWFWWVRGPASEGWSWLEGALTKSRRLGHTPARAKALYGAGGMSWIRGEHAVARRLMEESVAMYRELQDQRGLSFALRALGWVVLDHGDFAVGRAAVEESLEIYRAAGDDVGIGRSLNFLGTTACVRGDYERARALCEESLTLCRQTNDEVILAQVLHALGNVAGRQGNPDEARAFFEESLAVRWRLEDRRGIVQCMEGLAGVACEQGEAERAARLFGAAEACREILGAPLMRYMDWQADQERHRAAARAVLGEDAFASAWAQGRARGWEEAKNLLAGPGGHEATEGGQLTSAQWEALQPLLSPARKRGRPRTDDRRTLEGILYVLRTRCRWQDLPACYGSPTTCWRRFAQWQADGTWERLWTAFLETLDAEERRVWAGVEPEPLPQADGAIQSGLRSPEF